MTKKITIDTPTEAFTLDELEILWTAVSPYVYESKSIHPDNIELQQKIERLMEKNRTPKNRQRCRRCHVITTKPIVTEEIVLCRNCNEYFLEWRDINFDYMETQK